ncbi:MAG: DUF4097 family beta strand repeat-containing protein, partial [Bdellovibrionota bacterium]
MKRSRPSRATILSFSVAAGVLGYNCVIIGPENFPDRIVAVYDKAVFPRVPTSERATIPFDRQTRLSVNATDVDVEIVFAETRGAILAELVGDMVVLTDGAHLGFSADDDSVSFFTHERPAKPWIYSVPTVAAGKAKLKVTLPTGFSGDVKVETSSGRVDLMKASLSKFDVETKSGAVSILSSDVHVVRIKSLSGAVVLDAKAQDVVVETLSGPIESNLMDTFETSGRAQLAFRSKSGPITPSRAEASLDSR